MARLGVLLASIAALVVASVWALQHHEPAVVGSNGARPNAFVATVAPGKPVCTGLGSGRSEPDRLRLTVGTDGAGPQPLRIAIPGAGTGTTVSAGDGVVTLPLPAHAFSGDGAACVENLGRKPLLLAGQPGGGSSIGGKAKPYGVAYELVDTDPPRWSDDAGKLLGDVGLARAGAGGSATGYVVLVLLGLAFAGALAATFRWVR